MNPAGKRQSKPVLPRRPGMDMSLGRTYFRIVADLLILDESALSEALRRSFPLFMSSEIFCSSEAWIISLYLSR
jgi:hypothetical protein